MVICTQKDFITDLVKHTKTYEHTDKCFSIFRTLLINKNYETHFIQKVNIILESGIKIKRVDNVTAPELPHTSKHLYEVCNKFTMKTMKKFFKS